MIPSRFPNFSSRSAKKRSSQSSKPRIKVTGFPVQAFLPEMPFRCSRDERGTRACSFFLLLPSYRRPSNRARREAAVHLSPGARGYEVAGCARCCLDKARKPLISGPFYWLRICFRARRCRHSEARMRVYIARNACGTVCLCYRVGKRVCGFLKEFLEIFDLVF